MDPRVIVSVFLSQVGELPFRKAGFSWDRFLTPFARGISPLPPRMTGGGLEISFAGEHHPRKWGRLMELLRCPSCNVPLTRREAAAGWCEACGKKLPSNLAAPPCAGRGIDGWWDPALFGRSAGCLLLLLGVYLSYQCIYSPLAAAMRQEPIVGILLTGVGLCPMCLILGLLLLIFGKRVGAVLYLSPQQLSVAGGLFTAVMFGIGLLVYYLLRAVIGSYGYSFDSPF